MTPEAYLAIAAIIFITVIILVVIYIKLPRRINQKKYLAKWRQIQGLCADKSQWSRAVIDADNLLLDVLKKRRVKGKNMGEKMVRIQKKFTNNDDVWYGHKLRMKLETNPDLKLSQNEVKKALGGLRDALRDLGALK